MSFNLVCSILLYKLERLFINPFTEKLNSMLWITCEAGFQRYVRILSHCIVLHCIVVKYWIAVEICFLMYLMLLNCIWIVSIDYWFLLLKYNLFTGIDSAQYSQYSREFKRGEIENIFWIIVIIRRSDSFIFYVIYFLCFMFICL